MSEYAGIERPHLAYPVLYLVGTERSYRRYCSEHGLTAGGPLTRHVWEPYQLRGVSGNAAQVVFLRDWMGLREWREIYNVALSRVLARPFAWEEEDG